MRAAILRKTRESLTQTAQVTFEQKVMQPAECIPFHHEDQEYRYPNGSRVVVGGLDKPQKILSSEYDIIYIQEATECEEDDVEILITRLRNNVLPYQQLLLDCNPDDPNHWLNLRCVRGRTRRLQSKHTDNPTVTPEYLAMLDALTGFRRLRLRDGIWAGAEGQYFSEWNPDVHICEQFDIPEHWTRWVCLDYGFADPFCALWFARDPDDKYHIYIYREAYGVGLRDDRQAKLVASLSRNEKIQWYISDPATFNNRTEQQKPSIARVYWENGLRPLAPGVNKRIPGWQAVRKALADGKEAGRERPRLQILEGRAPNLVRTLPTMVADPLNTEDLADKIKGRKTEDHAVDALRYGVVLEAMPEQQKIKLRRFQFAA